MNSTSRSLEEDLADLARAVERETRALRAGGMVKRSMTQRVQIENYRYDPEFPTFSARQILGSREAWTREEIAALEATPPVRELLARCVSRAVSELRCDPDSARADVGHVVNAFIYQESPGTPEEIGRSAAAELAGIKRPWIATAWLDGVGVGETPLRVAPGIELRRPTSSDLELEEFGPNIIGHAPLGTNSPTGILTATVDAIGPGEVQTLVEVVVDALRLFKSVSAIASDVWMRPAVGWWFGGRLRRGPRDVTTIHAVLGEAEEQGLSALYGSLAPILVGPDWRRSSSTDPTPEQLAFRRYREALLSPGDVEVRMTSVVTCLEALFLRRSDGKQSLLSHRAASVLGALGHDRASATKDIREAYDIRSAYAHGETVPSRKKEHTNVLWRRIVDHARRCLVFRLVDVGPLEIKDDFIKRVDSM